MKKVVLVIQHVLLTYFFLLYSSICKDRVALEGCKCGKCDVKLN